MAGRVAANRHSDFVSSCRACPDENPNTDPNTRPLPSIAHSILGQVLFAPSAPLMSCFCLGITVVVMLSALRTRASFLSRLEGDPPLSHDSGAVEYPGSLILPTSDLRDV
jgi:hypothetical protein